jgi:hypothetical protein
MGRPFFWPSVFTFVRSRGSVIGISTRVQGGRSGVQGLDGSKKFSHLQNLQIGSEASQATIQWILVISPQ